MLKVTAFFSLLFVSMTCFSLPSQTDTTALHALHEMAIANIANSKAESSARQLLSEARRQHNKKFEADGLFLVMKKLYTNHPDSLEFYLNLAEPLFLEQKRYEELFRLKGWKIFADINAGYNKSALNGIEETRQLARKLHDINGEDVANQAMAEYYMRNHLEKEGYLLYEDILRGMEKRNAPMIKQFYVIRKLTKSGLIKKRLFYVQKLESIVKYLKSKGIKQLDDENPTCYVEYLLNRDYATAYLEMNNNNYNDKILHYLQEAEKIIDDNKLALASNEIQQLYFIYYRNIGQYDKALDVINQLCDYFKERKMTRVYMGRLNDKADIMMKLGRYQEAASLYRLCYQLQDSISSSTYMKELSEMRAQHDVDKLELQNKQMTVETIKNKSQIQILWSVVFALVIISFLLYYFITRLRRYSAQLKIAKNQAEESDRMKSTFLANMNHEIRTPLNAIVGFSQLLVDEDSMESRQEYSDIIINNNEVLQRLINDVLDFSKIESNSMTLFNENYPLAPIMNDIYNTVKLRMPENVLLELTDCEPVFFFTDRTRLTQIITNLINNAIKHTKKGFIRFGYEVRPTEVVFLVQDTGEGIPQDKLETIFKRFVQLNDLSKGVGLGLAICRGLVKQMEGSIKVVSEVNVGSTFYVTLPRKAKVPIHLDNKHERE